MKAHDNFVITRNRETGDILCETFVDENKMFKILSRDYAYADCDDSTEIVMISCNNREVAYVGWRANMEFTYRDIKTGEKIWSEYFPEYNH